ncbi:hypothetical protein DOTSEDRAFT_75351 [Dothistroma septosporum NZE10]|uniref:Uncharacterized protein n=1 Tax=Dothistroma septosporum (strain NZE10 / CBS 128990) TaxID=675120 RepID=M2YLC3_DOTSN|nr:hypothetical protein DOTSEDRAFT_75351 [Dothistroma septosporum NZE10]
MALMGKGQLLQLQEQPASCMSRGNVQATALLSSDLDYTIVIHDRDVEAVVMFESHRFVLAR